VVSRVGANSGCYCTSGTATKDDESNISVEEEMM
jgi:hypothetical protein